jgi:hypothetical protein
MRRTTTIASLLLCSLGAARAFAGVEIDIDENRGDTPHKSAMYLESDRMKMGGDRQESMIYRGDRKTTWVVNESKHSYREMNPETMAQMRSRMDAAMERMKQQMQSMPEAQRKQMEAMMGQRGLGQEPETVTFDKAGSARTVGKWSCAPYNRTVNGKPEEEMCLARMSDVGLARDDLKAFEQFSSFMQQGFAPAAGRGPSVFDLEAMSKAVGFDAFPVQITRREDDGSVAYQSTVTAVSRKTIAPATFEIPAGYTKEEMPPMGRRAPGGSQQ